MARVFITGSTDGLGLAAAQSLVAQGHEVVIHARSKSRAAEARLARDGGVNVVTGDLCSLAETLSLADQVNSIGPMDAVIHNAGIYTTPERGSTAEGHATILAVNTLAPYILTCLIDRPQRLVYLSSGLHRGGEGSLADIDWKRRSWDAAKAYAESKLHVAAIAAALARKWPATICSAVDPGWVRTRMGGQAAPVDLDTGQRTQSWLAVTEDAEAKVSGGYWHNRTRQTPAHEVTDVEFQEKLLGMLLDLTGIALP